MREKDLPIDRTCHVVYSKGCKAQIQGAIARHYPEGEREAVWEAVQRKYVDCLSQWRTDLGGSKNFHNGPGGTYDCAALMCYYAVCREVTSLAEIEAMEGELFLPAFRRLRFVDVNRPFWRKLLYRAFATSKKKCDRWHDYEMHVRPERPGEPIYYEFTACPTATSPRNSAFWRCCPPSATWTTPGWRSSGRSWCGPPPAATGTSATIPSAATGTRISGSTRSMWTRPATAAIAEEGSP